MPLRDVWKTKGNPTGQINLGTEEDSVVLGEGGMAQGREGGRAAGREKGGRREKGEGREGRVWEGREGRAEYGEEVRKANILIYFLQYANTLNRCIRLISELMLVINASSQLTHIVKSQWFRSLDEL